ncbi:hypothetical protein [Halobacillus sp. K22]|uniref:hypothetical protein n=1 Tax=Halobacillus sp. K22 TaxID=3457431 RepID=UPI003FCDC3CF
MDERYDSLDKHYKPIEVLKKWVNRLFVINVLLSFSTYFLKDFLIFKSAILFIFILTTLFYFIAEGYLSIFKIPEVEDKRRVHFLSNSFNVPLDNEHTNKYYNNNLKPSLLKLGANVFENALNSKAVTKEMVFRERIKIGSFLMILVIVFTLRTTNLELLSIVAQTLFTSTLLTSHIRLEVLHAKNLSIYNNLYTIFYYHENREKEENDKLSALLLDAFVKYEAAKAYSGVKQDTKLFYKIKPQITDEWEEIKQKLNIKAD